MYGEPIGKGGDMAALTGFLVYFLPTATALLRKRKSTKWIFAVNLVSGWTVIGWVVALLWSFLGKPVAVPKPRSKVADSLSKLFVLGGVLSIIYIITVSSQRGPRVANTPQHAPTAAEVAHAPVYAPVQAEAANPPGATITAPSSASSSAATVIAAASASVPTTTPSPASTVAVAAPKSTPKTNSSPPKPPLSKEDQEFSDSGGVWIARDTYAGSTQENLDRMFRMAAGNDMLAVFKMISEGKGTLLKKGTKAQCEEVKMFGGKSRIRLVGQTDSWWVSLDSYSRTPIKSIQDELLTAKPNSDAPLITQKPLKGRLSSLKLFLNQPLEVWVKQYPKYRQTPLNDYLYNLYSDKFEFVALVQKDLNLVTQVTVYAKKNQKPLSANEAAQIAASFGLSNPTRDPESKSYTNWGKEGDPVWADYDSLEKGFSLTTSLFAKSD
jgi:Superinfection immunity protein